MSQQRLHIIPLPHRGLREGEGNGRMAQPQHDEEERRASAEAYRQYRNLASAPIIWPPHLAQQQQQQLAFLWSQIDPRDQQQYMQELYRLNPRYMPPQPPADTIRAVEPIRLVNRFGHVIHVVEDVPDDGAIEDILMSQRRVESEDDNEDSGSSIPLMSRDGRVVYLIR